MAVSRPAPCPLIIISIFWRPKLNAVKAAFSAAVCAANGVPFLAPLKPTLPAEAHEITFPLYVRNCNNSIIKTIQHK